MICNNSIQSITGYISFVKNNHILILLDDNFSKFYVKKIINKYKPNYIFAPQAFFKKSQHKEILDLNGFLIAKQNLKKMKK